MTVTADPMGPMTDEEIDEVGRNTPVCKVPGCRTYLPCVHACRTFARALLRREGERVCQIVAWHTGCDGPHGLDAEDKRECPAEMLPGIRRLMGCDGE